jgi:hypothetical protein
MKKWSKKKLRLMIKKFKIVLTSWFRKEFRLLESRNCIYFKKNKKIFREQLYFLLRNSWNLFSIKFVSTSINFNKNHLWFWANIRFLQKIIFTLSFECPKKFFFVHEKWFFHFFELIIVHTLMTSFPFYV